MDKSSWKPLIPSEVFLLEQQQKDKEFDERFRRTENLKKIFGEKK